MSYYSNYEGYKPLFYKSDNDDVPMISLERYAPQGHYQDEWNQPYQSRSWNDEPSITKEIEQAEMSNLERLLKEAIEQTERHSRELDKIFDWNFEPNYEKPYDTFSNANEHVDDIEAIGVYDFESNLYVPYSSNFVFQDDSEDEMDEEDNDESTNYPHEISQVVLQESRNFEPALKECADFKNSDFEDSDEEELEIEEGSSVEEVVEISVPPIVEAASVLIDLNAVNEESENEVEVIKNKLEEAPIVVQNDKYADWSEDQVSQKLDFLDLDKELHALIGSDNGELQELRNSKDGMMTEEELLEIMGLKVEEPHPLDEELGNVKEDDMLCIKNSLETSLTDLQPNTLPCEREYELAQEPKPPDPFIPASKNCSYFKDVIGLKIDMERGIWCDWVSDKSFTTHIGSNIYGLLDDPGDMKVAIFLSLEVACGRFLRRSWVIIRLIHKPRENKWRIGVYITTLIWEMFYKNSIKIDDILLCEYDEKGSGSECEELAVYPKDK